MSLKRLHCTPMLFDRFRSSAQTSGPLYSFIARRGWVWGACSVVEGVVAVAEPEQR